MQIPVTKGTTIMKVSQPNLVLVGSTLQLGKGGINLVSLGSSAAIRLPSGVLAPVSVGEPSVASHASTKNYVDSALPDVYDATGAKLSKVKRILLQTTTNSSGAWSVSVPNIGQTKVIYVSATAISNTSAAIPSVALAHIKQYSTAMVSGVSTVGAAIVTGNKNSLLAAPLGTQIFVEMLVQ